MLKITVAGIMILFFVLGIAFAETVEFEGRYWVADLDAKIRITKAGIGEEFDLKSDLGIDNENMPEAIIYWHTGHNSKLRFAYTQAEVDGDQTVTRTIQFAGQTFNAGTRVVSDFEIKYLRFGWIWQFLNLFDKVKLGPVLELKAINADVSLDAPGLGIRESENFWAGLPTAGLAFNITPIKKLDLFAEFSGLPAGDIGYFLDAEAGIKIMPSKYFTITGGYRAIRLKAKDGSDFTKLDINGPFVGASIKF